MESPPPAPLSGLSPGPDGDSTPPPLVLVVDDDREIVVLLTEILESEGFSVAAARDGEAALTVAERDRPAVILLDLRMPRMDGYEFVRDYLRKPGPRAPLVLISGTHDVERAAEMLAPHAWLRKPFELEELVNVVRELANPG